MAETTQVAKIEVDELTEVSLAGAGIFDKLMQATKLHLQEEFDAGRIRGTEYASVYTQSLDTVMQQSIVFLLAQEKTVWENKILEGQVCKLKAEFDLITQQISKTAQETQLLTQKKITEEAQVAENVADPGSVLGKQIALYKAQTDGFQRDAEQKAARIFADAVAVTDGIEGEGSFNLSTASITNALNYDNLTLAVNKLMSGINASGT